MPNNLEDASSYNIPTYSRFNLSESESDIHVFIKEYKERIKASLERAEDYAKTEFLSFAEKRLSVTQINWLQDNKEKFFKDTSNQTLVEKHYLSECGFISSMIYTPDGEAIIVGHSTGLIQVGKRF